MPGLHTEVQQAKTDDIQIISRTQSEQETGIRVTSSSHVVVLLRW